MLIFQAQMYRYCMQLANLFNMLFLLQTGCFIVLLNAFVTCLVIADLIHELL